MTTPLAISSPIHKANRQLAVFFENLLDFLPVQGPDCHVLSYVAAYGPVRVGELKKVFGMKPSTLTGMLDRLECGDWILRYQNPADRRSLLVNATPNGRTLGQQIHRMAEEFERELLGDVTPSDMAAFHRVLDAVARATGVELHGRDQHARTELEEAVSAHGSDRTEPDFTG